MVEGRDISSAPLYSALNTYLGATLSRIIPIILRGGSIKTVGTVSRFRSATLWSRATLRECKRKTGVVGRCLHINCSISQPNLRQRRRGNESSHKIAAVVRKKVKLIRWLVLARGVTTPEIDGMSFRGRTLRRPG